MADITLTAVPWAPATSVGAYPRTTNTTPSGAPSGTALATATVSATATLTFTNLPEGDYWAAAVLSGDWEYVGFRAESAGEGYVPDRRFAQNGEWAIPNVGYYFGSPGLTPTANVYRLARYVPSRDIRVAKIGLGVVTPATANDQIDVGIYNAAGTRLVSSGATAGKVNGAGGKQAIDIAPAILIAGVPVYIGLAYGAIGAAAASLANFTPASNAPPVMFGSSAGQIEVSGPNAGGTLPATAVFVANSAQTFALAVLES